MRKDILEAIARGFENKLSFEDAMILTKVDGEELPLLLASALSIKRSYYGRVVTYSRKVFIPLTRLCRNRCSYCGFRAETGHAYMSIGEGMKIVKDGERIRAKEVLVSTGDRPEELYGEAKKMLRSMGYSSTVEYVRDFEERVIKETKVMMPHTNIGLLSKGEMAELKPFNASMGLMLESISDRLMDRGMPHENSPTKDPRLRIKMVEEAGELKIPFTTGILIGIGETWEERIASLLAIRKVHEAHGHIQEVIIQNFMPEFGTPMEKNTPPSLLDMLKTIAIARFILGGDVAIQAPPNLNPKSYSTYLLAGINDWGGISPLTPDFVNIAYPWPKIDEVKRVTEGMGFELRERLPIYPKYIALRWIPDTIRDRVEMLTDESGLVRRGEDAY
ncbi:MAG: 7,8-didemethyl-8-hydroxy-5-deazariboflavin synthase CofG [Nitrososphaerota archaeon]|nr:7,8-didemethyl-8-hydroxy-5-deazariboflavin synthase CofG [Nitrososphaerales archaeon]MDW8044716.1 7,8-didemethyl-8-hydroxy-5-deazariboflavin synthase CofG [Nitrososphaerota archaeon]